MEEKVSGRQARSKETGDARVAVVVEGVTETNLGWEARKWKGHEEGVGRVEGRVVDSWRPGPSKAQLIIFRQRF